MSFLGSFIVIVAKLLTQYGPAIEALLEFLERREDDKLRAQSMDAITRALHEATETGNTESLESAIRAHCNENDCSMR